MKKDYKSRILQLESFQGKRKYKYLRNYRMYTYSPTVSLDETDSEVIGYYSQGYFEIEDDTTSSIKENIIKSCIDTLASKIASQKVRPFFNTINGTFKDIQLVKQAQQYFDVMYDEWNVNEKITSAFKNACIFDTGYIFIDTESNKVEVALPWQVYEDPKQLIYNKQVDIAYKRTKYPGILLNVPNEEVTVYDYWNIQDHVHVRYIPEANRFVKEAYEPDVLPFCKITYTKPVKGASSNSVVDELYGLQLEVDAILTKIKDASQLTPSNTLFVPEDSSINANKLTNRVGEVVTYTPSPSQTAQPVTVATPAFIDPQYIQILNQLKQDAYEIVGISQLSATSQKPAGLNSGVALDTMENIESDRFEVQLNAVIRLYVDVAKKIMEVFSGEILPNDRNRVSLKWSDILKAKDHLSIQFSAAESLSKDPSQKLQQLQSLAAAGIIPQTKIAQLMELPDLQSGYSLANNSINAVMTIITRCIEKNDYDVPSFTPLDMLKEEIVNCCLSLEAGNAEENYEDIQKLLKLFDVARQLQEQEANNQAEANAMQAETDQMNQQADQYTQAGQQIDDIANQVQSGQMSPEDAQQFLNGMRM